MRAAGTAVVTDATYARDLALSGIGIAYILEPLVSSDIRKGRLKWVLPDSAVEEDGLFLYYPRRASMAPKTARLHRYRPAGIRAATLAGCRRAVASHT
ncbi:LysR substrate-binding domain-containing protein [Neorhizobium huautlense]|uniref:LysR substrate-binding domain-containing protein n=1 Tax=Neorhizobium huautlense TaxID=67774 RepID=UPI002477FE32|nr:LysR substrate-binding domain-containing protein [Neorhizobium huautlense]